MDLSNVYSPGYIEMVFEMWYDKGKPPVTQLYPMIPVYELNSKKPTIQVVNGWVNHEEWQERAKDRDLDVKRNFNERAVASKVEMLERHAEIGRQMQTISLEWLVQNKDNLTAGTAVRMLVDGIEIERATAGIPEAINKMMNMDDESLKEEIVKLLADAPVIDADYN